MSEGELGAEESEKNVDLAGAKHRQTEQKRVLVLLGGKDAVENESECETCE